MADEIVKIKELAFSYNGTNVIDGIDFCVEKGSFVSILGPNGSGKSTLINLISNVLKGFGGSITLFGKDIKKLSSRSVARLVAVVPHSARSHARWNGLP